MVFCNPPRLFLTIAYAPPILTVGSATLPPKTWPTTLPLSNPTLSMMGPPINPGAPEGVAEGIKPPYTMGS